MNSAVDTKELTLAEGCGQIHEVHISSNFDESTRSANGRDSCLLSASEYGCTCPRMSNVLTSVLVPTISISFSNADANDAPTDPDLELWVDATCWCLCEYYRGLSAHSTPHAEKVPCMRNCVLGQMLTLKREPLSAVFLDRRARAFCESRLATELVK